MSKTYRVIPTWYNGQKFRSRTEARWAVFFDRQGIEWEYEKEGYDLQGHWYLPDFWLPQVGVWAEVKGKRFEALENLKCIHLALFTGSPCLKLVGSPEVRAYMASEPDGQHQEYVLLLAGSSLSQCLYCVGDSGYLSGLTVDYWPWNAVAPAVGYARNFDFRGRG